MFNYQAIGFVNGMGLCMKERKNRAKWFEKCQNIKCICKIEKALSRHWRGIFLIIAVIGFPFALDLLHGWGYLRFFKNSFPGDAWFSFIGSYFPAMLIGCITIYQAHIIREKDMQYQALLNQRRFLSAGRALADRYSKQKKQIGGYGITELENMWQASYGKVFRGNWHRVCLIRFSFYDAIAKAVSGIIFQKLIWTIAKKTYVISGKNVAVLEWHRELDGTYTIVLFCFYPQGKHQDNGDEFETEMVQCMENKKNNQVDHITSHITVELLLKEGEKNAYLMNADFQMAAQENAFQLISRAEYFSCSETASSGL